MILFYLPLLLTQKEFDNMCLLENYYKDIFKQTDINVIISILNEYKSYLMKLEEE